jgi:cytochrome b561
MSADSPVIATRLDGRALRLHDPVLHWGMAMLVVCTGSVCLSPPWVPALLTVPHGLAHAAFGVLLAALVMARFRWRCSHLTPAMASAQRKISGEGGREIIRELSRLVYLLLYLVVGIRELIGAVHVIWLGGSISQFKMTEGQAVLGYGVLALVLIRVLAFFAGRVRTFDGVGCFSAPRAEESPR